MKRRILAKMYCISYAGRWICKIKVSVFKNTQRKRKMGAYWFKMKSYLKILLLNWIPLNQLKNVKMDTTIHILSPPHPTMKSIFHATSILLLIIANFTVKLCLTLVKNVNNCSIWKNQQINVSVFLIKTVK